MGALTSSHQHTMNPLKLETMALREVIIKKGLWGDYTGLNVPKMRQELEQLSRLPGDYEVVDEEITVARMDGREVSRSRGRVTRTFSQHWITVGEHLRVLLLDFDAKFTLLIPNIELGKAFRINKVKTLIK